MRILIISEHLPDKAARHGVFQRLRTLSEALATLGDLDFLFYVGSNKDFQRADVASIINDSWGLKEAAVFVERSGEDPGSTKLVADYMLPVLSMHRQRPYARMSGKEQVRSLERHLQTRPAELVFAHRLGAMCPLILSKLPVPPILFDLDDIEHKAAARTIRLPPKWRLKYLQYLQLPALWIGERKAIKKAAVTFVCSDADRKYLSRVMGIRNVKVIPNSSESPAKYFPIAGTQKSVLFLGAYSYKPNAMAAEELIRVIWPRIRLAVPDAQLVIAGSRPELIPAYSEQPSGVEFTGFVDDLDALYGRARVICTPIRSGGGTRIKIIEAAMHGRPVVSTRLGAEGLQFVDKDEIVVADAPRAMAEACVQLLESPEACERIGTMARHTASALYGRESVRTIVRSIAERIAKTQ